MKSGTKQIDIDRLRGAVIVAKNPKIVEAIQAGGRAYKFQEKFVRSAFLKAYFSKAEVDLLIELGWVVNTAGKPVKHRRSPYPAFLKVYGYRLTYVIKRTKKAR